MLSDILDKCLREVQAEKSAPAAPMITPAPIVVNSNAPTFKQVEYFKALVTGKQLTDEQRAKLLESMATATKFSMTAAINWLIGLPWAPKQFVPRRSSYSGPVYKVPKVAQGYYAVVDPADQVLKFYQVRVPVKGQWVGYVFVSQVSGDNYLSIRDKQEREKILGEIEKNPLEALKRFGTEIGECGHCRRQLTDEVSRAFGIGPVCRKDMGV